jgi:hypothetical protein
MAAQRDVARGATKRELFDDPEIVVQPSQHSRRRHSRRRRRSGWTAAKAVGLASNMMQRAGPCDVVSAM